MDDYTLRQLGSQGLSGAALAPEIDPYRNAALSMWRLSNDEDILKIIRNWKRIEWIDIPRKVVVIRNKETGEQEIKTIVDTSKEYGTDWGWVQRGKPLINDMGINDIIGLLESLISKNTLLTELDEERIQRKVEVFTFAFILDLYRSSQQYEIDWLKNAMKVWLPVAEYYEYALRRAKDRGEAKGIMTSTQERRLISEGLGPTLKDEKKTSRISFASWFGGKKKEEY